jgi:hypothetical protein
MGAKAPETVALAQARHSTFSRLTMPPDTTSHRAFTPDSGLSIHYPETKAHKTIPEIMELKLQLIASIGQANSIREYGGIWGVHGKYLLQGADYLRASFAEMVDTTYTPEYYDRAAELQSNKGVQVSSLQANFRDESFYRQIQPVEVSLLYEVILHQETYTSVIENVISKTTRAVLFAQPVLKESFFTFPCGCINLQFYPQHVKRQLYVPEGWFLDQEAPSRFTSAYWMWGQSASHIHSIFHGFGWRCDYVDLYDLDGNHWDYALMRFRPIYINPEVAQESGVT